MPQIATARILAQPQDVYTVIVGPDRITEAAAAAAARLMRAESDYLDLLAERPDCNKNYFNIVIFCYYSVKSSLYHTNNIFAEEQY